MTPEILSILTGAAVCAITAWLAFVKGWVDAAFGGKHHPGTPTDTWHIVARYGQYWPSLVAIPAGIAIGHFVGLWPVAYGRGLAAASVRKGAVSVWRLAGG